MNTSRPGLILVDGVIELPSQKSESVDNGAVEQYVTHTEMKMELAPLRSTLETISARLESIEKKVSDIKWWALGSALTIILAVYGANIAIQQMTVATFQAAAQQAQPSQPPQPPAIIINVPAPAAPASAPTRP